MYGVFSEIKYESYIKFLTSTFRLLGKSLFFPRCKVNMLKLAHISSAKINSNNTGLILKFCKKKGAELLLSYLLNGNQSFNLILF